MFYTGTPMWMRNLFMFTTMLIAVPTGVKVFAWIATLWGGNLRLNTPMLFCLGGLFNFIFGGITGVMLATVPIDIHVGNTYFVVAHFHYIIFNTIAFGIFAGIYHWFPKFTGRMFYEGLGKIHFTLYSFKYFIFCSSETNSYFIVCSLKESKFLLPLTKFIEIVSSKNIFVCAT